MNDLPRRHSSLALRPFLVIAAVGSLVGACSLATSFAGLTGPDDASATDASKPSSDGSAALTDAITTDSDGAANTLSVGLVGYWAFDETSGLVAKDSSGNGNDGALNGGVTHASGHVGGALKFDGTSGYVRVPTSNSLITPTTMSLAFWANIDAIGGQPRLLSRDQAWDVKLNGPNPQLSTDGPAFAISSGSLTAGAWYHLAFVFNAGAVTIYVDGAATTLGDDKFRSGELLSANPGDVFIAAYPGNPPSQFGSGLLDEVRIYNRDLSAAEIATLAQ